MECLRHANRSRLLYNMCARFVYIYCMCVCVSVCVETKYVYSSALEYSIIRRYTNIVYYYYYYYAGNHYVIDYNLQCDVACR